MHGNYNKSVDGMQRHILLFAQTHIELDPRKSVKRANIGRLSTDDLPHISTNKLALLAQVFP